MLQLLWALESTYACSSLPENAIILLAGIKKQDHNTMQARYWLPCHPTRQKQRYTVQLINIHYNHIYTSEIADNTITKPAFPLLTPRGLKVGTCFSSWTSQNASWETCCFHTITNMSLKCEYSIRILETVASFPCHVEFLYFGPWCPGLARGAQAAVLR